MPRSADLRVLEICAGAGGLSHGLERSGFQHEAAIEIDPHAAASLRANRPKWPIIECDVRELSGRDYQGIDLLAGGLPCQLRRGLKPSLADREPDLFAEALRLVREARPGTVMLESVPGLLSGHMVSYRQSIIDTLDRLGYVSDWRMFNAAAYGVPQYRRRAVLVAVKQTISSSVLWPEEQDVPATVGEALKDLMAANGWQGADPWVRRATGIAPTIVVGLPKYGGVDVGSGRAAWLKLGVNSIGLATSAPIAGAPADLLPQLTLPMVARLQGFDDSWRFCGRKAVAYRQIASACPPPLATAVGTALAATLGLHPKAAGEVVRGSKASESGRRGITVRAQRAVLARDGGECRFPSCGQGRLVILKAGDDCDCIGHIAHIRAVKPGGARYDPDYPEALLNESRNLLLLCPLHHSEVDRDPEKYPVEVLESWRDIPRATLPEPVFRHLRAV